MELRSRAGISAHAFPSSVFDQTVVISFLRCYTYSGCGNGNKAWMKRRTTFLFASLRFESGSTHAWLLFVFTHHFFARYISVE